MSRRGVFDSDPGNGHHDKLEHDDEYLSSIGFSNLVNNERHVNENGPRLFRLNLAAFLLQAATAAVLVSLGCILA